MMFSIIDNILATINQEQFELLNEASDIATYVHTYRHFQLVHNLYADVQNSSSIAGPFSPVALPPEL